jgi:hypothetical protein
MYMRSFKKSRQRRSYAVAVGVAVGVAGLAAATRPAAATTNEWVKYNSQIPPASDTVSTDGRISIGTPGSADSYRAYPGPVLKEGDTYRMWYAGYTGNNVRVFHATSPDGLTWTKLDNTFPPNADAGTPSSPGRLGLGSSGVAKTADETSFQVKRGDILLG